MRCDGECQNEFKYKHYDVIALGNGVSWLVLIVYGHTIDPATTWISRNYSESFSTNILRLLIYWYKKYSNNSMYKQNYAILKLFKYVNYESIHVCINGSISAFHLQVKRSVLNENVTDIRIKLFLWLNIE